MELSLAVTNSVADLIRRKIFCTEVFRIPLAGQVNLCCFDKTGTLTSDEMQFTGVRLVTGNTDHCDVKEKNNSSNNNDTDSDIDTVHSFTDVLEPNATLPWPALRIMTACHSLAVNTGDQANTLIGDPLEKAVFDVSGYTMIQNNALRITDAASDRPETILILQRFGFSSRLKRMSVLARESGSECTWVLAKGAPETLKQFLRSDSVPTNYDEIYMHHMARGTRVLAMAYRKLNANEAKKSFKEISRETVESDLIFAGFLLLHCPIKIDSAPVVSELWASGNKVVMITGDAILTAAEVARQVGIIRKTGKLYPPTLQLKHIPCPKNTVTSNDFRAEFQFVTLSKNDEMKKIDNLTLATKHLTRLQKMVAEREVALCVSGDTLQKLAATIVQRNQLDDTSIGHITDEKQVLLHPATQNILRDIVPMFSVFARHNPRQKEAIVAAFNLGGFITLMCGDGTNDVGALRRAHVGISIISSPEVEAKQRAVTKTMSQARSEQKRERKKKGTKKVKVRTSTASALEKSMRQLQEAQDELDQIELGDASIASPFTSRMVSIKCCTDVLQQGRCTLVTMLQIYKILGVNCLVNAMILSKLFLHGVKQGDRQLTILGLFVAGLFFFVTRGKPLPTLSAIHPPTSVLCPQALLSISSQFAIHYASMIIATEVALSFVDPYDPSMIPDGPFNPNTLNTCTFLISVLATVNTFAVNYRGEPFVEPLRQNKMLWRSLQVCYAVLFACALEIFPPLNDLFQLAEFPDTMDAGSLEWMTDSFDSDQSNLPLMSSLTLLVKSIGFRSFMTGLMICDTLLVFIFERLILKTFER
ncbi:MAG: cation-transporting ATPase 13A1 [Bacillariaceae sp.]|jgi:cation-transporting ATPase 13A1